MPTSLPACPLRLVRSSSAALPERVLAALEETFRAPVLEAYGMTEAAHQMASNPLPPRGAQARSVGLPAGPDIAVMAADGRILPPGETGEIVIRGPNVTGGTKTTRPPMPRRFATAGFARAIRAGSTPTATCG